MASGTPLVASRTGALPEVTGDAAVLVEPGNADALAAALRDLLDSPAERARLGAAAWQRVQERFAWPAVARATVDQYREAIDRSPGAPGPGRASPPRARHRGPAPGTSPRRRGRPAAHADRGLRAVPGGPR